VGPVSPVSVGLGLCAGSMRGFDVTSSIGPCVHVRFAAIDVLNKMRSFEEILNLARDNIRRTPDGKYSIDDVMKYVMDASHGHRCNTHRRVREQFSLPVPDRATFPGQGSHSVPVATADEIDRLLVLLPIARPVGRPRTRRLARQNNALGDSLYVMRTSFDAEHVKIGRSGDVLGRAAALESGQNFHVEVLVAFPGKGHLETSVHTFLNNRRSHLGAGREWFAIPATEAAGVVAGVLQQVGPTHRG
jgi:hypothetical protein